MTEVVTDQKASDVARRRALVKASPGLQVYGTFEEVQELVRRFKVMLPETKDMTDEEIVAFAQVAYAHGLNPLPAVREIIWIPGKGPMVAIRGWRRKGREWADEHELGLPDLRYELITDAVERERFEIPTGAMAYRCIGGFPVARAKYVQDAVTLREALGKDAPYQVILDTMGPMPVTIGIGYLTVEEMVRKDEPKWWHKCKTNNGKNTPLFGMDPCPACGEKSYAQPPAYGHAQHAMKRAEAHWWKQAADLPFAITPSGEGAADLDDVPITIAGTWKDVTPDTLKGMAPEQVEKYVDQVQQAEAHAVEQAAKTPGERKADAARGSTALFGSPLSEHTGPADKPSQAETVTQGDRKSLDKADRPLTPTMLASFLARRADIKHANGIASKEQRGLAMGALEECFAGDKASTEKRHSVLAYTFNVTSGNNLTDPQVLALLDWLAPTKDSGGKWGPDRMAVTEAQAVVATRMKETGQEELPEPVPF